MKLKEWGAFVLLGLVWGSSFLWIKIAVAEIGPATLVGYRLLFGVGVTAAIVLASKQPLPRDRATLAKLALLGITNTALPFVLISWGEVHIDSAQASILNGTVPLFTIVIAHFFLHDERITAPRLAGLLAGFTGVVVLVSRDAGSSVFGGAVMGQLAVILGSLLYAGSAVFARRNLRGLTPLVQALIPMAVADAFIWPVAALTEGPLVLPALPITWAAIAWLGILGSSMAYLIFFYLLNAWGPTRATVVTYVFPVVGLILGIVFLNERVDFRLAFGSLLIVGGIALVNLKLRPAARASSHRPLPLNEGD